VDVDVDKGTVVHATPLGASMNSDALPKLSGPDTSSTCEQSFRIFSKEQSLEGDGRIRALKSFSV
jgi:hypothetical protein